MFVRQDRHLDVSKLVGALTILSVYVCIAAKRFTQGQSCGYTRKQW